MGRSLVATLMAVLTTFSMAGMAFADDENMVIRIQNNTDTPMLLGPTRVSQPVDRGNGWKEETRHIEGGSTANIWRILDHTHFAKGPKGKTGPAYIFTTPIYTQSIDTALAHYLSRQMPTKAKKDSKEMVGIASFYDTSLLTYRIGHASKEKALVKANVSLVTQEGFLMKKKPKGKKSVALSVFVQTTSKKVHLKRYADTPENRKWLKTKKFKQKKKHLKRYATMADTPGNRKWLKTKKFKHLKTLGYMFTKKQPGTVPMRMYHSPGLAYTPYWKLSWAGGVIHSTASKKLALELKESSYIDNNKVQGYIYPYPDSQKIKKAVKPQMTLVQKVTWDRNGELSVKSGFVHAGAKCKQGTLGKNGLCMLKKLKLETRCVPGQTDCPYWVSSKFKGVFRKQRSAKRNKKIYPKACFEGKPEGKHNCIVARFTPSVKLPAQCHKRAQGKHFRSGGKDPKFKCPVYFNTDQGGIVFGGGGAEAGTWTRFSAGKEARFEAKDTIREHGAAKSKLTVTVVTNTKNSFRSYYKFVRNKAPVFWAKTVKGRTLKGASCKRNVCCSKGVKGAGKSKKRLTNIGGCQVGTKTIPKSCSAVHYGGGCIARTVARKKTPKTSALTPKARGLMQAFSHKAPVNAKKRGIPWMNSYLLSLVAAIVYEEQSAWRKAYYAALGLSEFKFLDSQKLKTGEDQQVSILHLPKAKKNQGGATVIIAIRGSTGAKGDALNPFTPEEDWMTNFEVTPVYRKFAKGHLHAGYAHGLDAIYPSFAYKKKPLFTEIIDWKRKKGQLKKGESLDVWITGHSMGGAVAHTFSHWLASKGREYRTMKKKAARWQKDIAQLNIRGVITFAAPQSHAYATAISPKKGAIRRVEPSGRNYNKTLKMADRTLRWENYRDTVPPMPNSMFDLPYHHVGQRLWIDWPRKRVMLNPKKNTSLRYESVEDHCVSRYAQRIYDLMPHKERKALSKIIGSKAVYAGHPHYWLKPVMGKDEESHIRTVPTYW
jgi:hypothetical protein